MMDQNLTLLRNKSSTFKPSTLHIMFMFAITSNFVPETRI